MAKKKFYVVWSGHQPGIYDSWAKCQEQIQGFKGADFKSFSSRAEAEHALNTGETKEKKKKSQKYYVVWSGHNPGVYSDWESAKKQIDGYQNAEFKTFGSKKLAEKAFNESPEQYKGKDYKKTKDLSDEQIQAIGEPVELSLSVDAACNSKTGVFEYRGVWTHSGDEIFRAGPYPSGSNNIGEFLALVHALAFLKNEKNDQLPIYSDSKIAMKWVRNKNARPKSAGTKAQNLILRAEKWLSQNSYNNKLLKWETKAWGEIPADFGRK